MSPAWVRFLVYNTGLVQYRWTNWSRPTDSGSTENARLENRKLFKILFKLLYLRFPPLQIRTYVPYLPSSGTFVFRTCVFSRPVALSADPVIRHLSKESSERDTIYLLLLVFVIAKYYILFAILCQMSVVNNVGQQQLTADNVCRHCRLM